MLVVLPVCSKDASHVIANLDHAHRLEGRTTLPYTCLITYDRIFAAERSHEVEDKARNVFANVLTHIYEPWPGPTAWPAPQNHAWQSAARHLHDVGNTHYDPVTPTHVREPWLWWEADATPLVAGWLDALRDAYAAMPVSRFFLGPIAITVGGHMNGVAVYPWNTPTYCPRAMRTSNVPFDVALSSEVERDKICDAAHLIHHYPRWTGVRLRITDRRVSQALVAKGYALHHGCNDGSLRTCLAGVKPERLVDAPPHTVHVLQLSNYLTPPDEALSRWHHAAHTRSLRGWPLVPFALCSRQYPSIVDQARATGMECGFFPLPLTPRMVHFNPAMTRHPDGSLYLLTRRWNRTSIGWHSDMHLHRILGPSMELDSLATIILPKRTPSEQLEDPRLHIHGNYIFLSYVAWQPGVMFVARQRLSVLNLNWSHQLTHELPYGENGRGKEKNWTWFHHDGRLHMLYQYDPHTVVEVRGQREFTEHKVADIPRAWQWGEIRGGTPPVRVGDEMVTFFHSSVPWKARQNRYAMGAYAFSAAPPFAPTRITRDPLLVASDLDTRRHGGPPCVFPGGVVHEDGSWLVALGVNDEACAWLRISDQRLNDLLRPVV